MSPAKSLAERAAAPGFSGEVMAVIASLAEARTSMQALQVLKTASAAMGADASAFVSFVKDDVAHDTYRFLLACDPVWCAEYELRAWYAEDPWLEYAAQHSEPAHGHEIPASSATQRDLLDLARQYGFRSALIVPAPSSGNLTRLGVLCLGSATEGYFLDEGYRALKILARGLAMELHSWWVEQIKQEIVKAARLTGDDLVLLNYERKGQCSKAIAAALSTSEQAVNSRFQRINARLGVPNRRAAAQLAAEFGLI
jgi:DNA-binding CsgD family transcriptional regulator